MIKALKISASFYIYAGINAAAFVFCSLLMVETKGRPKEEVLNQLVNASLEGWRRRKGRRAVSAI